MSVYAKARQIGTRLHKASQLLLSVSVIDSSVFRKLHIVANGRLPYALGPLPTTATVPRNLTVMSYHPLVGCHHNLTTYTEYYLILRRLTPMYALLTRFRQAPVRV